MLSRRSEGRARAKLVVRGLVVGSPGGDRDGNGNTEGRIDKRVVSEWVGQLTSGKVDPNDFWEVTAVLESKGAGAQIGGPYCRLE